MSELKPGWRRVKFGEVVRLGKERCADPASEGIERYIGLEHLEPGDLRVRSWGDVADGTTFTTRVRPGHLLFGKRRAYQRKVAVADFDAVCSGDIYVFESADPRKLLPELLPFICQTDAFFDHAVGTSAGSLSPRTNWTSLAEYEFVLPPLDEQRSLAARLGAANMAATSMSNLAEACRQLGLAYLEHQFALARQAAPLVPIEEVSVIVTKGESPKWQGFGYVSSGVRFVTSENVLDGSLSLEPEKFVPAQFGDKLRRSALQPGDVLINIVGGSIGRMCLVPDGIGAANVNQAVAVVRPDRHRVLPAYLLAYLRSPVANHALVTRSVDDYKPNLSLTSIRHFRVPALSLDAQELIIDGYNSIELSRRSAESRHVSTKVLLAHLTDHRSARGLH